MRQFGLNQPIPRAPDHPDYMHTISLKGRYDEYWPRVHRQYIAIWDSRQDHIITGEPLTQPLGVHSEYIRWYKRVTRRWITPIAASIGLVVRRLSIVFAHAICLFYLMLLHFLG